MREALLRTCQKMIALEKECAILGRSEREQTQTRIYLRLLSRTLPMFASTRQLQLCLETPIMHRAYLSLGRMNLGIFDNKRRLLIRLKSAGLSQWMSRLSCWGRARPKPTTSTGPGLSQQHLLDQDWKQPTSMVAVPSQQPQDQTKGRDLYWTKPRSVTSTEAGTS